MGHELSHDESMITSFNPEVTVILPTYNRLHYLTIAVESVLAQSFGNWELIVADDGSDDQTRSYLRTLLSNPRVRVMFLPHSGNPGAVRNRALQQARGEYVAFLDSDDVWLSEKLELQLAVLKAKPQVGWSYTDFIRIADDGRNIDFQRRPDRVLHEGSVTFELLQLRAGIAMPTVMAARALLDQAGGFDENILLHEDYDLWLRLSLLSPIAVLPQPLACVRRHGDHFSSLGISAFVARRRVLEKMQRTAQRDDVHRAVLAEQARLEVELALLYASAGQPLTALRTLANGWRRFSMSPAWYLEVASTFASAATRLSSRLARKFRGRRPGR